MDDMTLADKRIKNFQLAIQVHDNRITINVDFDRFGVSLSSSKANASLVGTQFEGEICRSLN